MKPIYDVLQHLLETHKINVFQVLLLSLHLLPITSALYFSDKSENIIRISSLLIHLFHSLFFYIFCNFFLGSFFQSPIFIFGFFSGVLDHCFRRTFLPLSCILYFTLQLQCVYITFTVLIICFIVCL